MIASSIHSRFLEGLNNEWTTVSRFEARRASTKCGAAAPILRTPALTARAVTSANQFQPSTERQIMSKQRYPGKTKPTHYAKVRHGQNQQASYEQIGAAWDNGNGSLCDPPHGTQIVQGGFSLYPAKSAEELTASQGASPDWRSRSSPGMKVCRAASEQVVLWGSALCATGSVFPLRRGGKPEQFLICGLETCLRRMASISAPKGQLRSPCSKRRITGDNLAPGISRAIVLFLTMAQVLAIYCASLAALSSSSFNRCSGEFYGIVNP